MANDQRSHPTTGYIRTIFHLGLFGLLSLLFSKLFESDSTAILALKIGLAAILPYYPASWASRIKSRSVLIALLLAVTLANVFLIYLEVNPKK